MPARSRAQQRFFGMVHAYQKGKFKNAPEEIKSVAKSISYEAATEFAKTKHDNLPEKKAHELFAIKLAFGSVLPPAPSIPTAPKIGTPRPSRPPAPAAVAAERVSKAATPGPKTAASNCRMAPSHTRQGKVGKPIMPQPHRSQTKAAFCQQLRELIQRG